MSRTVFTVGHSTHSIELFLSLLRKYDVEVICDVRSVPYSGHNPQFNREQLKATLSEAEMQYVFLGKELGARSENPDCYIDGKVQYNRLVDEPEFIQGMHRLKAGIARFRVALMCAERDPITCHRTILVCRELRSPDLSIEHILADGKSEPNDVSERRLMAALKIAPDMLLSERDCVEHAYNIQAGNIAYTKQARTLDHAPRKLTDENLHDRLHE